jgi:biopolymer transport protein ExbD
MATPRRIEHPQIELQIAPMIDVCFLLLFFYILTSKPAKPESDLSMKLPGTVAQEETVDIPDEQRIEIQSSGQVLINDLPVDAATDPKLPQLTTTLKRFKLSCDANKANALVTLLVADDVPHQRIADIMNACAVAQISGLSFGGLTGEEE